MTTRSLNKEPQSEQGKDPFYAKGGRGFIFTLEQGRLLETVLS